MGQKTIANEMRQDPKKVRGPGSQMLPPEGLAKLARLVIIDDDPGLVKALKDAFEGICEMPPDMCPVKTIAQAIGMITKTNPEIVVCDKNFDSDDQNAYIKLLVAIKNFNPKAIVILHSGCEGHHDGEEGFDAVIPKGDSSVLITFVTRISSGSDGGAVPRPAGEENTDRVVPKDDEVDEWNERLPTNIERKARLLIIDNNDDIVSALGAFLSDVCIVTEGTKSVKTLEDSIKLVEGHKPDILIVCHGFDLNDNLAQDSIAQYWKSMKPDASVILIAHGDQLSDIKIAANFDRVIDSNNVALIKETVKELAMKY